MAIILNIDTATEAGSVCLAKDGAVLGFRAGDRQKDHASVIVPFVLELIASCGLVRSQVEAVCISGGPGSYTGLRVAAATAKGLCYAWGVPLIAIGTLEMMAAGMRSMLPPVAAQLYCPVIDARRQDVFTALFDQTLSPLMAPAALTLDTSFLQPYRGRSVQIFGTGMAKCEQLFPDVPGWSFRDYSCDARHLAPLSQEAFTGRRFQDLAYFEPFYLKSFYRPAPPAKI